MRLEITSVARADIFAIQDYGLQNFGIQQTRAFLVELTDTFKRIARSPGIARVREDFRPPVRVLPHKSLVIIYRVEEDHVKILRVVYARQNWQSFI
jgi:toxin ParE1/3/4